MSTGQKFIDELNSEVRNHRGVRHPFLMKAASKPFSRQAWLAFGQQLYPHVHFFVPYMEMLLLNTWDIPTKVVEAEILLSEYGEDYGEESHVEHFRRFVRAAGGDDADLSLLSTPLDPATIDMIEGHMQLCGEGSFLRGLGAIGPAHEYAITAMFPPLVEALKIAGFEDKDTAFFALHAVLDIEHSKMFDDAIVAVAKDEKDLQLVREGTLASLSLREKLWDAMDARMTAIDEGRALPVTAQTLAQIAEGHRYVPSTFWADAQK